MHGSFSSSFSKSFFSCSAVFSAQVEERQDSALFAVGVAVHATVVNIAVVYEHALVERLDVSLANLNVVPHLVARLYQTVTDVRVDRLVGYSPSRRLEQKPFAVFLSVDIKLGILSLVSLKKVVPIALVPYQFCASACLNLVGIAFCLGVYFGISAAKHEVERSNIVGESYVGIVGKHWRCCVSSGVVARCAITGT